MEQPRAWRLRAEAAQQAHPIDPAIRAEIVRKLESVDAEPGVRACEAGRVERAST